MFIAIHAICIVVKNLNQAVLVIAIVKWYLIYNLELIPCVSIAIIWQRIIWYPYIIQTAESHIEMAGDT